MSHRNSTAGRACELLPEVKGKPQRVISLFVRCNVRNVIARMCQCTNRFCRWYHEHDGFVSPFLRVSPKSVFTTDGFPCAMTIVAVLRKAIITGGNIMASMFAFGTTFSEAREQHRGLVTNFGSHRNQRVISPHASSVRRAWPGWNSLPRTSSKSSVVANSTPGQ